MNVDEIPITETILYRLCNSVYDQYKAQHERQFNEGLAKLHRDVEQYLDMDVAETPDQIVLTFLLNRSDINGSNQS